MNYERLLKMSVDFGTVLLQNGAEIYRVEESIQRLLKAYGVHVAEVFAIPHLIVVTMTTPNNRTLTRTKRLYIRDTNFDRIQEANDLVRRVCAETPDLDQVFEKLADIRKRPIYPLAVRILLSALTGIFFTLLFGGRSLDAGVTGLAITVSRMVCFQMDRFHANAFFVTIVASFIHTVIASMAAWVLPDLLTDRVIMGTLMILVPGVTFTTAIRDIIAKDLLAGIIEGMEALLVASAIAIGSAAGFLLMSELGVYLG